MYDKIHYKLKKKKRSKKKNCVIISIPGDIVRIKWGPFESSIVFGAAVPSKW